MAPPRTKVEKDCQQCGKPFLVRPQRFDESRFCSWECRYTPRRIVDNGDGTATVPLTRGLTAVIDADDIPIAQPYNWTALEGRGGFYAHTWVRDGHLKLHRLLLDAKDGQMVDHVDGNGLNNRRSNLRIATHGQNVLNRRPGKRSLPKGVSARPDGKYRARVYFRKKCYSLGDFDTPEEAAEAYNQKAIELHGDFARVNH